MTEYVEFPALITKGLEIDDTDGRRIFKGHITAEIIDRQQEFVFVKEVMAIMETFMKVNPVMSEVHTNRMVGKVLDYQESKYQGVPTVLITGEVYKVDGVTLYDKVWDKIVKGEYRGLSMGGASKEREPIIKDGRQALELRKLELYEIAICPTPANPFAIIEKVNTFAKANHIDENRIQDLDGRCILKCDQLGMCFEKGLNIDNDNDVDNMPVHEYVCVNTDKCDKCGKSKEEHGLEQFDKPEIKKKETLTGESASTRSDNIGQATHSPKQTKDIISQIKQPRGMNIKSPQAPTLNKQTVPEDPMPKEEKEKEVEKLLPLIAGALGAAATGAKVVGTTADIAGKVVEGASKVGQAVQEGVSNANKMTVHQAIDYFGEIEVRKALEERDVIRYIKDLSKKYQ